MVPLRGSPRGRRRGSTALQVAPKPMLTLGMWSSPGHPTSRAPARTGAGGPLVVVSMQTPTLCRPTPSLRPVVIVASARRDESGPWLMMLRHPRFQRPIIEPFIIQPSQSPFMCWRIQAIMSSHQESGGAPVWLELAHDWQLASIRSGSPHIIMPIIRPSVTCWFIHAVMSPHQFDVPAEVAGTLIIQFVHAWFTLETWTAVEAWAGDESSRPAAIASPTPRPAAKRATAMTGRSQRRRVAVVETSVGRMSVMPLLCSDWVV